MVILWLQNVLIICYWEEQGSCSGGGWETWNRWSCYLIPLNPAPAMLLRMPKNYLHIWEIGFSQRFSHRFQEHNCSWTSWFCCSVPWGGKYTTRNHGVSQWEGLERSYLRIWACVRWFGEGFEELKLSLDWMLPGNEEMGTTLWLGIPINHIYKVGGIKQGQNCNQ